MASSGKRAYGSGRSSCGREPSMGSGGFIGRQVKRKLGPCREPGTRTGLTRSQAEARLRELMAETQVPASTSGSRSRRWAGATCATSRRSCSASRTTIQDYRIILGAASRPVLRRRPRSRKLTPDDVAAYISAKRRAGLAIKTITNHLNFAHGVFAFAIRRGWVVREPGGDGGPPAGAARRPGHPLPRPRGARGAASCRGRRLLGPTDRVLWLTAAMTGLRQGELAGLRWRDVDWSARLVRVRRSYSRGQLDDAEEPAIEPRRSDGRSRRSRARAPLQPVVVHARRRPRVLPSADRPARTTRARAACDSRPR